MKLVYFVILLNHVFLTQDTCEPLSLDEAIESADIVFRGNFGETLSIDGQKFHNFYIKELYKSNFHLHYESVLIRASSNTSCNVSFAEGKSYLVYANLPERSDQKPKYLITDKSLRTRLLISNPKKLPPYQAEIEHLQNLICEYEKTSDRGCPRHLSKVCGCDGKTYGNACEASRNGITKWQDGACR